MIRVGNEPFLECSSKGEKRLSAFFARIKKRRGFSIEELFQASKVFEDGKTGLTIKEAKGKKALNQEEVCKLYAELWDEYFSENPDLINLILDYNGFTDIFGKEGHCCQAVEVYRIQQKYKLKFLEHYSKLFEKWLYAAFQYYHFDNSIMPDLEWDSLGRSLIERWDFWDHPFKYLVRKDEMFSAFYIPKNKYPKFDNDGHVLKEQLHLTKEENVYSERSQD